MTSPQVLHWGPQCAESGVIMKNAVEDPFQTSNQLESPLPNDVISVHTVSSDHRFFSAAGCSYSSPCSYILFDLPEEVVTPWQNVSKSNQDCPILPRTFFLFVRFSYGYCWFGLPVSDFAYVADICCISLLPYHFLLKFFKLILIICFNKWYIFIQFL